MAELQGAIAYTDEELTRCDEYCVMVIELLKPLSKKEKFLVVKTLHEGFPVERLFEKEGMK